MSNIYKINELKKELEKEQQKETPDMNLINRLTRQIFQLGMTLTYSDIYNK